MTEDSLIEKIVEKSSKFLKPCKPLWPFFKCIVPIVLLVAFILFGFLVGWLAKILLQINDDTVILILILSPILGYVVLSGRLSALKGPGGFEAQFVVATERKIEFGFEKIAFSDLKPEPKMELGHLYKKIIPSLDRLKPNVLTFTLGKDCYDRNIILKYIEALLPYQSIKFVVFLNEEDKLVAYVTLLQLKNILESSNRDQYSNHDNNYHGDYGGSVFVQYINNGDERSLKMYQSVMTATISTKYTNIEALQEMSDKNLESIIVVDEDQKLKGIIQREQILTKLMLSIAKGL